MSIHDRIKDRSELGKVYAEDGAFYSAARVFRELADEVELHAKACDAELEKFMQKGSGK